MYLQDSIRLILLISIIAIITSNVNGAPAGSQITYSGNKKDVFMSRGWGASGMPFSMFYMNNFARLQYEQQLQQQQDEIERNRKAKFANTRSRTHTSKANEKEDKEQTRQNNTYPPQLFVSYGWGPMG